MRVLLLLLGLMAWALPSAAEPIPLARISAYLDGLERVRARFTQLNADGTISTGRIYIARPGRVRFEYDPPARALVVADGAKVAIFDLKTLSPPEQFPLRRTPLWVILGPRIDLSRAGVILAQSADDTTTTIVAQDPENPEIGTLSLTFTDDPVELRKWVVTDESGAQTTVILGEVETGIPLETTLFDITGTQDRLMGINR